MGCPFEFSTSSSLKKRSCHIISAAVSFHDDLSHISSLRSLLSRASPLSNKYSFTTPLAKFKSFQRTLNLWSFETSKKAAEQHEHGCRYHPLFVRGRPELCYQMKRVRVKRNNTTSKLGEEQKAVLSATGHGEKGRPRIIIPSSQQPPPAPQENIDELHSTEDDAPRTTFTQQLLLSALLESSRPQPYIQAGCEDYALSSAAASFSRRIPPLKDDQHMLQAKRTCELILGLGSTPSFKAARSCFRPSPGMGGNLSDLNGPVLAHLLGSSSSLLESTLPRAPASNSLVGLAPAASHFCPMPPVLVPPLDMANVRRLAASMLLAAIALADSSKRGQEERVVKGGRC